MPYTPRLYNQSLMRHPGREDRRLFGRRLRFPEGHGGDGMDFRVVGSGTLVVPCGCCSPSSSSSSRLHIFHIFPVHPPPRFLLAGCRHGFPPSWPSCPSGPSGPSSPPGGPETTFNVLHPLPPPPFPLAISPFTLAISSPSLLLRRSRPPPPAAPSELASPLERKEVGSVLR